MDTLCHRSIHFLLHFCNASLTVGRHFTRSVQQSLLSLINRSDNILFLSHHNSYIRQILHLFQSTRVHDLQFLCSLKIVPLAHGEESNEWFVPDEHEKQVLRSCSCSDRLHARKCGFTASSETHSIHPSSPLR